MLQGVKLSKTQSPTTAKDRKRMKYALTIGSIKYAMQCTRSIVYPTLSLARENNSDLGVDHWTVVKNILSSFQVFQDVLDRCLVIHSWITLVPPC